jgi:hypothetical protein
MIVMKYAKMLKLSLIFLSLANAVAFRREKSILFNRVAIIILLYSSIVGYDSLAITSLGRGISIYGGLFHSTAINKARHEANLKRFGRQSSNCRSYCTNNYHNLNPKFVTGFTDGEGSFIIRVIKSPGYRSG